MTRQHLNITIRGKVQGVFFRDATKQRAQMLGVAGFVRNEPDGTVSIEAEGKPKQLDALLAWVKTGTERAHVEDVHVESGEMMGYREFVIAFYE